MKNIEWIEESKGVGEFFDTGSQIIQLTNSSFYSHNIYCEQPYCTGDGRRLVFMRNPSVRPQKNQEIWICDIESKKAALIEKNAHFTVATSAYSGYFYYVVGDEKEKKLICLSLESLEKKEVFDLTDVPERHYIGSVSPDLRYYVNKVFSGPGRWGIIKIDLKEKTWKIIHEKKDLVNPHMQFDPKTGTDILVQHNRGAISDEKGNVIRLVGEEGTTLYVIDHNGENYRFLPVGEPYTTSPATGHECWIGNTGGVILTLHMEEEEAIEKGNLVSVFPGKEKVRVVSKGYRFNHISVSRDGRFYVADARNIPSAPIVVGSIKTGNCKILCNSNTSNGSLQHTHPHPYFTGDNKWVIFNSDRTGVSQIYAASVPEGFLETLE